MSEVQKFYSTLTAIPRLNVGDCVYRTNMIGQYEEAMVVSVLSTSTNVDDWSGTLMTKNGVEYVSGYVEHRSTHDWMPVGFITLTVVVGLRRSHCYAMTRRPRKSKTRLRLRRRQQAMCLSCPPRGMVNDSCLGSLGY